MRSNVPMGARSILLALVAALALPAGARAATTLTVTASGPAYAVVGQGAAYTFTVANQGTDPAMDVMLAVPVPATATLMGTAGDGTCTPGATVRCTIAEVPAQQSATTTVTFAGSQVGATLTITATATASGIAQVASTPIQTLVTAPSVPPPPSALPAPPCANVQRGTLQDDVLVGTPFGDALYGLRGRDLLRGGDGDDCLWGGTGDDVIDGDGGNDRISGADGRDRLIGGVGNDRIDGGKKSDRIDGGPGDDEIVPGTGRDHVWAGSGNDIVNARDGSRDIVYCGPGTDRVRADRRDVLRGCEQVVRR
jgi:uncharacterized repeat protein (TIGR01451 family)